MLDENQTLPQLIIIDGGKGQLGAALEALDELSLRGKVVIVGIAKRLEEIFYPGDQYPIYIDKRSESLKLIQFMRNEAHRFGITHHRNKRSKNSIQSELLEIKGIGEKTMQELFKEFKIKDYDKFNFNFRRPLFKHRSFCNFTWDFNIRTRTRTLLSGQSLWRTS